MPRTLQIDPGYKPLLREGERDLAVRAAQGALTRALEAKGIEAHNLGNGAYGSLTRQDVNRLEHALGITPVKGSNIGPETWKALTPYLSTTNKRWLSKRRRQVIAHNVKEAARRKALEALQRDPRVRLEKAATRMWGARHHLTYSMLSSRPFVYNPDRARHYDCSATVSVIYYLAGLLDPNGLGHNGYGFTGTQWPRGRYTLSPQPGDVAFYGYMRGSSNPSHEALVISEELAWRLVTDPEDRKLLGRGLHVLTFGHDPMQIRLLRYRGDFRGCRSYV